MATRVEGMPDLQRAAGTTAILTQLWGRAEGVLVFEQGCVSLDPARMMTGLLPWAVVNRG